MKTIKRKDLSYSEIRTIIGELKTKLSSIPQSPDLFYNFPFLIKDFDKHIVYNLQNIANNMCHYLGMFVLPQVLYIDERGDISGGKKGIFYCDTNGSIHTCIDERDYAGLYNGSITIVNKKGYTFKNLLGILAHEITHHYLRQQNICMSTEAENEIFTDITAIYLGFGHILFQAYKIISYTTNWSKGNDGSSSWLDHQRIIGYITTETILRTIAVSCENRNSNPKKVIEQLEDASDRFNISGKLFKYRTVLLRRKILLFTSKIKKKINELNAIKIYASLESTQKKYEYIKKIMSDGSKFKNKNISKDDGEFLVNLTNELYSMSLEEEIIISIKNMTDAKATHMVINKCVRKKNKELGNKIDVYLFRLNGIIK
jgi:hypothetical protein